MGEKWHNTMRIVKMCRNSVMLRLREGFLDRLWSLGYMGLTVWFLEVNNAWRRFAPELSAFKGETSSFQSWEWWVAPAPILVALVAVGFRNSLKEVLTVLILSVIIGIASGLIVSAPFLPTAWYTLVGFAYFAGIATWTLSYDIFNDVRMINENPNMQRADVLEFYFEDTRYWLTRGAVLALFTASASLLALSVLWSGPSPQQAFLNESRVVLTGSLIIAAFALALWMIFFTIPLGRSLILIRAIKRRHLISQMESNKPR